MKRERERETRGAVVKQDVKLHVCSAVRPDVCVCVCVCVCVWLYLYELYCSSEIWAGETCSSVLLFSSIDRSRGFYQIKNLDLLKMSELTRIIHLCKIIPVCYNTRMFQQAEVNEPLCVCRLCISLRSGWIWREIIDYWVIKHERSPTRSVAASFSFQSPTDPAADLLKT